MFGFLGEYASLAKWVIIGLLALGVVYGVNKVYRTIQENAILEQRVALLVQEVKEKEAFAELTQRLAEKKDEAILQRDQEIEALNNRLDALTDNLPPSARNQSSDVLKETVRKLREIHSK